MFAPMSVYDRSVELCRSRGKNQNFLAKCTQFQAQLGIDDTNHQVSEGRTNGALQWPVLFKYQRKLSSQVFFQPKNLQSLSSIQVGRSEFLLNVHVSILWDNIV